MKSMYILGGVAHDEDKCGRVDEWYLHVDFLLSLYGLLLFLPNSVQTSAIFMTGLIFDKHGDNSMISILSLMSSQKHIFNIRQIF